jgi:hypothetical protein
LSGWHRYLLDLLSGGIECRDYNRRPSIGANAHFYSTPRLAENDGQAQLRESQRGAGCAADDLLWVPAIEL